MALCKKEGCGKILTNALLRRGMVYCSSGCAPYGKLNPEGNTRSTTKRERSSIMAQREKSPLPLKRGSPIYQKTEKDIEQMQNTESTIVAQTKFGERHTEQQSSKESIGENSQRLLELNESQKEQSEEEKILNMPARSGINGMSETKSESLQKLETAETDTTPAVLSTEQLMSSETEKLISLPLVNDVIDRLHAQMKKICPDEDKNASYNQFAELKRTHAAVATAMAIANMIKLKVASAKIIHELKRDR